MHVRLLDMPPRCVNVKSSAQKDCTSSAPSVPPRRVNRPDEGVGLLMEVMIGSFQWIVGVNLAPALANPTSVNQGFLVDRLQTLGVKEFS
ncbi:hypothetical protein PVK06_004711 [Gossypium arboreum]|uniref:Uncharacterized protein n=1 Tax=Gossypium arboreum TaxID=29729 RepID=A0ABR0QSQ7_GOSAR|nr:hypothetical protein PVK06_004711 [Gossypium arboreum]